MNISKNLKVAYLFILVLGLLSCASKQLDVTDEEATVAPPKLLFLNYKMDYVEDIKTISLINQITTDGKLKAKVTDKNNTNIGDLEYVLLDKNFNSLETYSIKNPLKKPIEYINDYGEFEKKILDLNSVQFSLKLQRHPKSVYVVINEITETGIIKHITTKIE